MGAGAGTTVLSIAFGVTAGYLEGWPGHTLSFLINLFLVVPPFLVVYVLAVGLALSGMWWLITLTIVASWGYGARLLRSQTLSLRRRGFIEAAALSGERTPHLLLFDLLPHLLGLVAFILISAVLFALQTEFGVEFLGWGVQGVLASDGGWGTMLQHAWYDNDFFAGFWWTWLFPSLGMAVTGAGLALCNVAVLALNDPR